MNDENAAAAGEPGKQTSARKLASCRANGAKSNGPKTEAGRRRSAQNAIKHGLTAVTVVVSNEDQGEFDRLYAAYIDHFQPRNPVEIDLVAEIVCAKWRQRRLWSVESAQLDLELFRQRTTVDQQFEFITEDVRTALAYEEKAKPGESLFVLNRYESRLSGQYHRALRTLMELQASCPPAQSPTQLTTDNRQLTTEPLPNEPNPDSGQPPNAQCPRFRIREASPALVAANETKPGAGVNGGATVGDPIPEQMQMAGKDALTTADDSITGPDHTEVVVLDEPSILLDEKKISNLKDRRAMKAPDTNRGADELAGPRGYPLSAGVYEA